MKKPDQRCITISPIKEKTIETDSDTRLKEAAHISESEEGDLDPLTPQTPVRKRKSPSRVQSSD